MSTCLTDNAIPDHKIQEEEQKIYLCTWFIHAVCFGKRYQNVADHKTHLVYIMFSLTINLTQEAFINH